MALPTLPIFSTTYFWDAKLVQVEPLYCSSGAAIAKFGVSNSILVKEVMLGTRQEHKRVSPLIRLCKCYLHILELLGAFQFHSNFQQKQR